MSNRLGLVGYERPRQPMFLPESFDAGKNYSEAKAAQIDEEVSRKIWRSLWPDVTEDQVPIDYVTNGVHVPTWIEPKIRLLLDRYLGTDWLDKHDDPGKQILQSLINLARDPQLGGCKISSCL